MAFYNDDWGRLIHKSLSDGDFMSELRRYILQLGGEKLPAPRCILFSDKSAMLKMWGILVNKF